MKYLAALMTMLFCLQNSFAQATFQTKYEVTNNSDLNCLLKSKDGGSTAILWQPTGCIPFNGCKAYISAHHFNAVGALVWSKDYKTDSSFSRPQATETADGGFVLFGQLSNIGDYTYHGALLAKCNSDGNVEWSKQIQSANFAALTPQLVSVDDEGNLLLCYTVSTFTNASSDVAILKIDKKGRIVWNTFVSVGIPGDDLYVSSFTQNAGTYYFACNKECGECQGYVIDAILLTVKAANGALTVKTFDTDLPDDNLHLVYADKLFSSGNTFYLKGVYYPNTQEPHSYIAPFTDTATSVVATVLADDLDETFRYQLRKYKQVFPFHYGSAAYFDADGSYTTVDFETGYNLLQRYDPLGRICPDLIIPEVDTTTTKKLFTIDTWRPVPTKDKITISDKRVRVSAGTLSATQICSTHSFSMKTEDVIGSVRSIKKAEPITIFPNPARDVVHVSGIEGTGATLAVLSPVGVVLQTLYVRSPTTDIPVSNLQPGQYFLRVTENGKATYTVPFIKQSR